jgi:hypothetical protein
MSEIGIGRVLGDAVGVNSSVQITSPTNTALQVSMTPMNFAGGQWNYSVDWCRIKNAAGSLYITLKSNTKITYLSVNKTDKCGSAKFMAPAAATLRVDFWSLPNKRGVLLLRKYPVTLYAPRRCRQRQATCAE